MQLKRYSIIAAAIIVIAAAIIINPIGSRQVDNIVQSFINSSKKQDIENDSLYFMKWDAFHYYSSIEEPYIQLACIYLHKHNNDQLSFRKCTVISDIGEIPCSLVHINYSGSQTKDFSLITIELTLPRREQGKYIINKLKLFDKKGASRVYDIGKWVINIEDNACTNDLVIGKKTFVGAGFDWYIAEITNQTKSMIEVSGLLFQLNNIQYNTVISSGTNFSEGTCTESDIRLRPNQTKTFLFRFQVSNNKAVDIKNAFVSIRPIIIYKENKQKKSMILDTIIYSPQLTDEEIKEMLIKISEAK